MKYNCFGKLVIEHSDQCQINVLEQRADAAESRVRELEQQVERLRVVLLRVSQDLPFETLRTQSDQWSEVKAAQQNINAIRAEIDTALSGKGGAS